MRVVYLARVVDREIWKRKKVFPFGLEGPPNPSPPPLIGFSTSPPVTPPPRYSLPVINTSTEERPDLSFFPPMLASCILGLLLGSSHFHLFAPVPDRFLLKKGAPPPSSHRIFRVMYSLRSLGTLFDVSRSTEVPSRSSSPSSIRNTHEADLMPSAQLRIHYPRLPS